MKKYLATFSLIFFLTTFCQATHIRGGYITAKRIAGFKYEFLLTIYRDSNSPISDETNNLYPDASLSDVLTSPVILPKPSIPGKATEICQYRFEYTYKSPGIYTAFHYQFFRNANVLNMDLSVNTTFYVETKVIIDPFLALDQSPVITKAAVDFAAVGSVYRYNPGAYDPDGDSLSYQLVPSRQYLLAQERSAIVTNYRDPAIRSGGLDSSGLGPAKLTLDPLTGDLVWDVPRLVGEFNTAIKIIQWRKIRANRARRDSIGFVLLDMQIIVKDARNKRPLVRPPKDTCVVAGSFLQARIFATDPDINDRVKMSMFGELDTLKPDSLQAQFLYTQPATQPFFGDFRWQTRCIHVRKQPYFAYFQAEDVPLTSGGDPLVDLRSWRIKVVGPSPVLESLVPDGNGRLRLNWRPYPCSNAIKMQIYRKIDSSNIALDTCKPGMPSGAGFVLIDEVPASNITYLDDNKGQGLKKGPAYCYRLVAVYPDPAGGESLVSNELCKALELQIPVLVNVDVEETSAASGKILVRWTRPFFIDTTVFKPPFTTEIYRFRTGVPPVLVRSTTDTTDTVFVDSGLDTRNVNHDYQLHFKFGAGKNLVDSTEKASAVRLDLNPGIRRITLQWLANTPWSNAGRFHYIFRKIDDVFVLIDSTLAPGPFVSWTDEGNYNNQPLSDTVEYCYKVETQGSYANPLIRSPLFNTSQEICASPTDTLKPCAPPDLVIQDPIGFSCDDCALQGTQTEFTRILTWKSVRRDTCGLDVNRYRVYYTPYEEDASQLIATTTDTFFVHSSLSSLAGCYEVNAVDRSGNESDVLNRTCVDNCIEFRLPNTILPEGTSPNQVFRPSCFSRAFIRQIRFTVFNRWGKKVFEDDVPPEINWDGQAEGNTQKVVPGIYFYIAEVKAIRLRRQDEQMKFTGWILIHRP